MLLNEEFVQITIVLHSSPCRINIHNKNHMILSLMHIVNSLSAKSFSIITLKGSLLSPITDQLLKQSAVTLLSDNLAMSC